MRSVICNFRQNECGSMAIVGALFTGAVTVAGGVALDLSRMSTAKTELMQVLQTACEHGGAAIAAGDEKRDVKESVEKLTKNAYDQSSNLKGEGEPKVQFTNGGSEITVSDKRVVKFIFGGLTGVKDSEVAASFSCDVPAPPINMTNPTVGCTGDAITISNAQNFLADANTAEMLTSSRLITVAMVDSNGSLVERTLVGDGGEPLYSRTNLDPTDTIVIQPVVGGVAIPVTCLPVAPPGGTGGGAGPCLTGPTSGSAAGNELGFDTDGTYQAFFIDQSAGQDAGSVSNGASSASTSAYLDGDGVTSGYAAVGQASSVSCSSIVTANASASITSTATGDETETSTDTTTTTNDDGTTTATADGTCNSSSGNGNGNGNGNAGSQGSVRSRATGSQVSSTVDMNCGTSQ